ncbi:MAG: reverse transcriptase-like protein [Caldilineaceae bacterium]
MMQHPKTNSRVLWVFCDGGAGGGVQLTAADAQSRGMWRKYFREEANATAAAIGRDSRGRIVDWRWQRLGVVSNNEAEYAGLLLGLEMGLSRRVQELTCVMDSEVVVGQMLGHFGVNSATLRALHWQACAAARQIPKVHYCLVPREWNRLADGLAGQAMMPWQELAAAITAFNTEVFRDGRLYRNKSSKSRRFKRRPQSPPVGCGQL